ncbi:MAG: hypothetical protein Q3962_06195 [Corynebacterium sp.]|nr:hypothetical protein [Corynebacterium sp.]
MSSGSTQESGFWYLQAFNPFLLISALIMSIGELSFAPLSNHFKLMNTVGDLTDWASRISIN